MKFCFGSLVMVEEVFFDVDFEVFYFFLEDVRVEIWV